MASEFSVGPAAAHEQFAALRLIFQYLPFEDQAARVENALDMFRAGEIDSEGLIVVRDSHGLIGAMIAARLPGQGAVIWPPQARPSFRYPDAAADVLIHTANQWIRSKGVKLAQALVLPEHKAIAEPLTRHGFRHITSLCYLRHFLDLSAPDLGRADQLEYRSMSECDPLIFRETLDHSYSGTLDCPEINGIRTIEEVIEGHQGGDIDPNRWWLAKRAGRPVGVLLMNDEHELGGWDIAYVGVVPDARRHGVGRALVQKALFEAKAAGVSQVTLAVDSRNQPARKLYHEAGFEEFEVREVFLSIWPGR